MADRDALEALRLIAAQAADIAKRVALGQTWPGEVRAALDAIEQAAARARQEV
jgi:hypothetical protein